MSVAKLLVDLGPCDDDAHLFINARRVVSVGLGETRQFRRDLEDGDYNVRLQVINSGAWAWQAKLRLVVNGDEFANIEQTGGTGPFYTGDVYNGEWQFRILDGKVSEFS